MIRVITYPSEIVSLEVSAGSTNPSQIYPSFNNSVTDYCVLTDTLVNDSVSTFSITINSTLYTSITSVNANDLLEITDTANKTYYVRFLPKHVIVGRVKYGPTAEYEPGYYLAGHPYPTVPNDNTYHTIYDYNGVPVWYVNTGYTSRSLHSTLSSNVVLANHESGYPRYMIDLNNFNGQYINATKFNILSSEGVVFTSTQYTNVQSPLNGWGLHEFQVVDIPGHGTCAVADGYTTNGFYIQIMDTSENIVWDWKSEDYLGVQPTEYFHLNSVDVHPTTFDVLVSLRHDSAVFCIDYNTKQIKWVLQGEPAVLTGALTATLLPLSGYALSAVNTLQIVNDAIYSGHQYTGPKGQHDARWQTSIAPISGGQHVISFYDDQKARPTAGVTVTFPNATNLPRAAIFEIDVDGGFAYNRSSITNSGQSRYMGSYSIVNGISGISHTVDYVEQHPPLVEFVGPIDGEKTKTFAMDFSNLSAFGVTLSGYTENLYRIAKTPLSAFNIDYLRATAGFPVLFPDPVPTTDTAFLQLSSSEVVTDLNISVGGNTIFPSTFTTDNRDYCVLTNAPPQASISYTLTINGQTITNTIAAKVNNCLQIYDGIRTYYIRFLPTNITLPTVTFYALSAYSPGYYAVTHGITGNGTYYTILNEYGVPLWYVNTSTTAISLHVGMSANRVITNASNNQQRHIIQINDGYLRTEVVDLLSPYTGQWDIHESTEVRAPSGRMGNVIGHYGYGGLYIQEQDPSGNLVWEFDINNTFNLNPNMGGDTHHVNSIQVHPETGDILCSARHTSTVFCIDYNTRLIKWVIQGNPYFGVTMQELQKGGTPAVTYLTAYNEPYYGDYQYNGISGNHDARWHLDIPPLSAGNIVISVFDDQSIGGPYARGVIYEVNPTLGTAYCRSSIFSEQGASGRMGSYRINKEEDNTYTHTIGWGGDDIHPSMTEYRGGVDGVNGRTKVLTSNFGDNLYRYLKYPIDSFNIDYLRKTVGVPLNGNPPVPPSPPPTPPLAGRYLQIPSVSAQNTNTFKDHCWEEVDANIPLYAKAINNMGSLPVPIFDKVIFTNNSNGKPIYTVYSKNGETVAVISNSYNGQGYITSTRTL